MPVPTRSIPVFSIDAARRLCILEGALGDMVRTSEAGARVHFVMQFATVLLAQSKPSSKGYLSMSPSHADPYPLPCSPETLAIDTFNRIACECSFALTTRRLKLDREYGTCDKPSLLL